MNIIFAVLFIVLIIFAVLIFIEGVTGSGGLKSEMFPFMIMSLLACLMMFFYVMIYKTPYTIIPYLSDRTHYKDVSEISDGGFRTTIEKIEHSCKIVYEFDRELIVGDMTNIKSTVSGKCSDLDPNYITGEVEKYRKEINGNQD